MARQRRVEFTMEYRIAFECVIRGHHIYKDTWNPVIGEILNCRSDPRVEAIQYDSNALGLYKEVERVEHLVGHVPVEVSCLLTNFLNADMGNNISAAVIGRRKREIGLVVPTKYKARTKNKKIALTLQKYLLSKKATFPALELNVSDELLVMRPHITNTTRDNNMDV